MAGPIQTPNTVQSNLPFPVSHLLYRAGADMEPAHPGGFKIKRPPKTEKIQQMFKIIIHYSKPELKKVCAGVKFTLLQNKADLFATLKEDENFECVFLDASGLQLAKQILTLKDRYSDGTVIEHRPICFIENGRLYVLVDLPDDAYKRFKELVERLS